MSIVTENVTYGPERSLSGYLAYPGRAAGPLPAVILIHEAGGIMDHTEDLARRIAAAGYAVLAPELVAERGRRPVALTRDRATELLRFFDEVPTMRIMDPASREEALAGRPPDVAARLREAMTAMFEFIGKMDRNVELLLATTRFVRSELERTRGQKVMSIGFCIGGALSARLAAADPDLAGAVVFYGLTPPEDALARIRCPVIAFYAERDERINADIPSFRDALARTGVPFEHHVYPGTRHAFFNDDRATYDVPAARDAWVRTLGFFRDRVR